MLMFECSSVCVQVEMGSLHWQRPFTGRCSWICWGQHIVNGSFQDWIAVMRNRITVVMEKAVAFTSSRLFIKSTWMDRRPSFERFLCISILPRSRWTSPTRLKSFKAPGFESNLTLNQNKLRNYAVYLKCHLINMLTIQNRITDQRIMQICWCFMSFRKFACFFGPLWLVFSDWLVYYPTFTSTNEGTQTGPTWIWDKSFFEISFRLTYYKFLVCN